MNCTEAFLSIKQRELSYVPNHTDLGGFQSRLLTVMKGLG